MSRLHDWLKNIDKKENAKLIWIKIGKLIILDCIAWVATRGYPNSLLKRKQDKHAAKAFFYLTDITWWNFKCRNWVDCRVSWKFLVWHFLICFELNWHFFYLSFWLVLGIGVFFLCFKGQRTTLKTQKL